MTTGVANVNRNDQHQEAVRVLAKIIEPRRKQQRISLRDASDRAGMSEATWRQLVAGGVNQSGVWVDRIARRDQLLDMAQAVDCLHKVATEIEATDDEIASAQRRVVIPDPAEQEIMSSRFLGTYEKLRLLEELRQLREEPPRR